MSKESKATASDTDDNQVAARDTTFDGVKIERFWIGVTNLKDKEKLQVIAEINGIDKVVWEMKPSYAERTEGLVSDYSNFKWLLEAYAEQKVLEERARSARLLEALKFYADRNNWMRSYIFDTENLVPSPWADKLKVQDCAMLNCGGGRARLAIRDYNQSEGGDK